MLAYGMQYVLKLTDVSYSQCRMDQSSQGSGPAAAETDHVLAWPVLIPVATAVVVSTAVSFSALWDLLALLLGFIVICGWLVWLFAAIAYAGWRHTWRRLASLLAILVVAIPATAAATNVCDYLHFLLALPYYTDKIASSLSKSERVYFHWPSAGFVPSYERNLVYDPSDELASHVGIVEPVDHQPDTRETVRHFIGHFYLVEDYYA